MSESLDRTTYVCKLFNIISQNSSVKVTFFSSVIHLLQMMNPLRQIFINLNVDITIDIDIDSKVQ